jgi:C4-dicarboxylate-specific signal transduction histidine kinase
MRGAAFLRVSLLTADLARVFEPFFTTKVDGLGMGLAISHTIIEAHGGRLLVDNDPAGGAIFRIHLRADGDRRFPEA